MQKSCLSPIKSSTTITLLQHLIQMENLKSCKSQHKLHARKILQHRDTEMSHLASEQVEAASLILESRLAFLAPRCAKLPGPLHWLPIKEQCVVAIDELSLHNSYAEQVLPNDI